MNTIKPDTTSAQFTREYFECGEQHGLSLYTDYRWLPDLTIPMVEAIVRNLNIRKSDSVLDFGCAKGYVVRAFRELGYNAHGVDISTYAIGAADSAAFPFVQLVAPGSFMPLNNGSPWNWVIAKDVMEHVAEEDLHDVLAMLSFTARKLLVIVPLGDGRRYVIPDMEKDVTHRIRRPIDWWTRELNEAGFQNVQASYSMLGVKDNWCASWPKGNGFLIAE